MDNPHSFAITNCETGVGYDGEVLAAWRDQGVGAQYQITKETNHNGQFNSRILLKDATLCKIVMLQTTNEDHQRAVETFTTNKRRFRKRDGTKSK